MCMTQRPTTRQNPRFLAIACNMSYHFAEAYMFYDLRFDPTQVLHDADGFAAYCMLDI